MATESKDNSQSKVFVGIDGATRSWAISIISEEGKLLQRMNIVSQRLPRAKQRAYARQGHDSHDREAFFLKSKKIIRKTAQER